MSFKRLVDAFAATDQLPVLIDDIRRWIIGNGFQDEIWFLPVDMNQRKLRGGIRQYTYRKKPYSEPLRASNVYYSKELNTCWNRLVCSKEMMHIFDRPEELAGSRAILSNLVFDLGSPTTQPATPSKQVASDWLAIAKALIVLAPLETLEQLRPFYQNGTKNPYDLALFLRIPEYYINYVFSPRFLQDREALLKEHA